MNNDANAPGPDHPQQPSGDPYGQPYGQGAGQPPYGQHPGQAPYGQSSPQPPYQQPSGHPYPGQPYYAPAPMAPQQEASTALWAHLCPLLASIATSGTLGFLVPLIMWLVYRDRSFFVAEHAKESLNFQITLAIVVMVSIPLMFVVVGFFVVLAALILGLVWTIQASIAANRHLPYRYPVSIRFVR